MRLRQCTPRQPLPNVQITPQKWKLDPDVSVKHDDLHARAQNFDYEKLAFDAE